MKNYNQYIVQNKENKKIEYCFLQSFETFVSFILSPIIIILLYYILFKYVNNI